MAFSSWVSIIVTNAVLKFLRLIKKNVKNLLKSDESDIFDEAIVIERNEPEPSQAHAYSKALEFLYFLANMEWAIVPVCRDRIREYIMDNRPVSSLWGMLSRSER
ncbi:hypothetical protein [Klebsiella variicola]|uniref:hypothetical protein n=1 Tax=Klebsiella variicola TaxID=244366 RepID=UPI001E4C5630|nr:hypothetical protein [Klebsiella variicola]